MNKKELKQLNKFFKKHSKHDLNKSIDMYTERKNGLGELIKVKCYGCCKQKEISDVKAW